MTGRNKNTIQLVIVLITLAGGFLRFYHLKWGNPYFFHPDERNIAYAITRIRFPDQLNPKFFAYGSFPIYLTYAIGSLSNLITRRPSVWVVTFTQAIMIGRTLSALLATLLIPLTYTVTRDFGNWKKSGESETGLAVVAALLVAVTPGLIQYAHFATFETVLTFEYLLLFGLCLKISRCGQWRDYLLAGFIMGLSLATKVTSLIVLPLLLLAHWLNLTSQSAEDRGARWIIFYLWGRAKARYHLRLLVALVLAGLVGLAFSPYLILDYASFRSSLRYESTVAMGTVPVFYTAGFLKTRPFLYQLTRVFPYLLGGALCMASFAGLVYLFFKALFLGKLSSVNDAEKGRGLVVLLLFFSLYFVFHGVMFVKWMRYMVPLIPYLILAVVIALKDWRGLFAHKAIFDLFVCGLVLAVVFSGLSFFTRYLQPDPRVQAAEWAKQNVPREARFLSEHWDLGILPFNSTFPVSSINLFDFYELDGSFGGCGEGRAWYQDAGRKVAELATMLAETDYVILPSQRVYLTRLRLPECFPVGSKFYRLLFEGELGFNKIYEAPVRPSLRVEETYLVFDYPTVVIFEKREKLAVEEYRDLLAN